MLAVLGLDPFQPPWAGSTDQGKGDTLRTATDALITTLLAERAAARAAKDFTAADAIRDTLARAGFAIEDAVDGSVWSVVG